MSEYNEGDLVEAVKGERLVRGRVYLPAGPFGAEAIEGGGTLRWYESEGFTLTVIEKAAPKVVLPSEPGHYIDHESDLWTVTTNGRGDPEWHHLGNFVPLDQLPRYAPFTKLEPVSETAKKVLDIVRKNQWANLNGEHVLSALVLDSIAADFGVAS